MEVLLYIAIVVVIFYFIAGRNFIAAWKVTTGRRLNKRETDLMRDAMALEAAAARRRTEKIEAQPNVVHSVQHRLEGKGDVDPKQAFVCDGPYLDPELARLLNVNFCARCGGTGYVKEELNEIFSRNRPCPTCSDGRGERRVDASVVGQSTGDGRAAHPAQQPVQSAPTGPDKISEDEDSATFGAELIDLARRVAREEISFALRPGGRRSTVQKEITTADVDVFGRVLLDAIERVTKREWVGSALALRDGGALSLITTEDTDTFGEEFVHLCRRAARDAIAVASAADIGTASENGGICPTESAQRSKQQAEPSHTSRNAPCPCNSGKKFKECHGRLGPAQEVRSGAASHSESQMTRDPIDVIFPNGRADLLRDCNRVAAITKGRLAGNVVEGIVLSGYGRLMTRGLDDSESDLVNGIRGRSGNAVTESEAREIHAYLSGEAFLLNANNRFAKANGTSPADPAVFARDFASGCRADTLPNANGIFGRCATNPVPTTSIRASKRYLNLLRYNGAGLQSHRDGSIPSTVCSGSIDVYTLAQGGRELGKIYVSPYHKVTSTRAPDGFTLAEVP